MADPSTVNWQRRMGATIGIGLMAFALAYRMFPDALHVDRQNSASPTQRHLPGASAPMGFDTGNDPRRLDPANAGPPISLAPSDVILARQQAAANHTVDDPASAQLVDLLERGDAAMAAGRLAGSDDSALSWYLQALQADPDSRAAEAGLAQVGRRVAAEAQDALQDGDEAEARNLFDVLTRVPGSETAAARLKHQLDVLDEVTPLLSQAASQLKQGNALSPAKGSALDLYHQVLAIDADNRVAQEGMLQIQEQVLDQALAAAARSEYPAADDALDRAAAILPESQQLQDTGSRIQGMRRQQAENLLAQARSALDSGNFDLAEQLAGQAIAMSPDLPEIAAFRTELRNARLYARYQPGQTFSDRFLDRAGASPEMVVIPTGRFMMGSPETAEHHRSNESPRHEVVLGSGFALGRREVSVGQFGEFVRASGYVTEAEKHGTSSVYDARSGRMTDVRGVTWKDGYDGRPADSADPVVNLSWGDAQAYVEWLAERTGKDYRLPSEAEFEYAMRSGTASRYWWGDGAPDRRVENLTGSRDQSRNGRRWANAFDDYGDGYWGPAPVGSYIANAFGLYDMDGNVSEWVADCWHDNYLRAPHDGSAWVNPGCSARVVRGGSWGSAPEQVRSAYRIGVLVDTRSGRVGFRVARDL